jgi:hypothetical protein
MSKLDDVKNALLVIVALGVFAAFVVVVLWHFVSILSVLGYVALQAAITIAVVAVVIAGWNAFRG